MSAPYVFDGQTEANDDDIPVCEGCGVEVVDAWPVDTLEAVCRDCEAERQAIGADQAADCGTIAAAACAQEVRRR